VFWVYKLTFWLVLTRSSEINLSASSTRRCVVLEASKRRVAAADPTYHAGRSDRPRSVRRTLSGVQAPTRGSRRRIYSESRSCRFFSVRQNQAHSPGGVCVSRSRGECVCLLASTMTVAPLSDGSAWNIVPQPAQ